MTFRSAQINTAEDFHTLTRRYPDVDWEGTYGGMSDGVLIGLSPNDQLVSYPHENAGPDGAHFAYFRSNGRPYTLVLYDGLPESRSGWQITRGQQLPLQRVTATLGASAPIDVDAPAVSKSGASSQGSERAMLALVVLGVVVAILALD